MGHLNRMCMHHTRETECTIYFMKYYLILNIHHMGLVFINYLVIRKSLRHISMPVVNCSKPPRLPKIHKHILI